ncbi:c-type cytochrome [Comamonas composti]|uniref:c-type cytochrome n=1 Tax=Comamonas composti TaxID=408558 RepID=UPI00047B969C|nr:c-type cytochrome [Comamonas composti]
MTDFRDDEENYPPRPRWIAWVIAAFMAAAALGVANIGWRIMRPASVAALPTDPVLLAGKTQVEASDCMRCHGLSRNYVGPSFQQISQRYGERSDAIDYLERRIREGSVGEWGRTIMPRHPQLSQEQARQMAAWILAQRAPAQSSS